MIREIKYFIFAIVIIFFIFFIVRYYFSDEYKKKSYRSLKNIENKINLYSESLPILENDTSNSIEYIKDPGIKKRKKFYFWELIEKND